LCDIIQKFIDFMEELFQISNNLVKKVAIHFERSLVNKINRNARLIEIRGARGVGKTTLLLQQIKKQFGANPQTGLYLSLDDPYFYENSLVELAETFIKYGGVQLFIDEVHRYTPKYKGSDWSKEIKIIYDRYPELKIVYTGSSTLELYHGHGDLSRRRSTYVLNGLSFREYLEFNEILTFGEVTLKEIVLNHTIIANDLIDKTKILKHFRDYIQIGYFPFYQEDPSNYYRRIIDILALILESDLPSVVDITFDNIFKLKRLLSVIATSSPYTPNLSKLRENISITDHRTLLKYLYYLDKAEVINLLQKEAVGNVLLRKPDKIYLNNTNLAYAISPALTETGNLRETFFYNQLKNNHQVTYPPKGDFMIDGQYIFELGGRNKNFSQIEGIDNAYVVADEIELGVGKKIPLWMFGFLY